jgi:pyridoxal phosphate enzyme (YggS family)
LQAVRARIERAAGAAGRRADEVMLLAVTKTVPVARVLEAYAAGQRAFGESYAQEGVEKITALGSMLDEPRPVQWHFIGPIQSNKTRAIAGAFQWVHSVERERIAVRLNDARPAELPPLQVCIEVNVSGERSKSGVAPGGEAPLAEAIARLPRLRLRGLMTIPEPTSDTTLQRRRFALLRNLQEKLASRGYPLDTLSMGMSDDFEAAIMEGATIVRIGTAIFGPRPR